MFPFLLSLAADVPRCRIGDTECITRVSMTLIHKYARTGYPAAAFPIVEPFVLKRFDISDGRDSSLSLKLSFHDIIVEGLSAAQIDRAV